jgi:XXXCH domain-containing protein
MPRRGQHQEFKLIKRRLSALQRTLKTDLEDGQPPQKMDVDDFVATSREMERLCEDQWRTAMAVYINRLAQFQVACTDGNLQSIRDCFQDLLERKMACHKAYR